MDRYGAPATPDPGQALPHHGERTMHKGRTRTTLALAGIFTAAMALVGCSEEEQGPAEEAGEQIDEAAEDLEGDAGEAAEETGDAVEETADSVEEATDQ